MSSIHLNLSLRYLQNDLKNKFKDVSKDKIAFAVAYSHNLEEAIEFRKEFGAAIGVNPENIEINPLSLSVGTHVGPGILAAAVSKSIKDTK